MNTTYNSKLKNISRVLRKNMTKEERHLWYDFLRKLDTTVHRQKIIGKYVVDFYIASVKIVVELDGSQHYTEMGYKNDVIRDKYLSDLGIEILRYSNLEIQRRFEEVCKDIQNKIEDREKAINLKVCAL